MRIHLLLVVLSALILFSGVGCKKDSKPTTPAPAPAPAPVNTPTPCTSPASFGVTTYSSVLTLNPMGYILAGRYNIPTNGRVIGLSSSFMVTGTPQARMAIYSDNGGAPGTLLAQSANVTVTTTGWNEFDTHDFPVTAGYYWLAITSTTGVAQRFITVGGDYRWQSYPTYQSFPVTLDPDGSDVSNLVLHADYCP